jgi:Holliday junction resolvase
VRESEIEKHLVQACRNQGWLTYKFSSPAHRGVPDRIVIRKDNVFFVEVKTAKGKLTALQEKAIADISTRRISVYVVKSKDEVDAVILHERLLDDAF